MDEKTLKEKLVELAKSEGLAIAEEQVEALIPFLLKMIDVIVAHTKTPIDDAVWAALRGLATKALENLADKISDADNA